MNTFSELKKIAKNNDSPLSQQVKVAILSDSSTQFLCQALKGTGVVNKVDYNIWEADYGQISRQILDPDSELYSFNPDYIVLLRSPETW